MPIYLTQSPEITGSGATNNIVVNLARLGMDADQFIGSRSATVQEYQPLSGRYFSVVTGSEVVRHQISGTFIRSARALEQWDNLLRLVGREVSARSQRYGSTTSTPIGLYEVRSAVPRTTYNMGELGLRHRWQAELIQKEGSTPVEREIVVEARAQIIYISPQASHLAHRIDDMNWYVDNWNTTVTLGVSASGGVPWPLNLDVEYLSPGVPQGKWQISKNMIQGPRDEFTISTQGIPPTDVTRLRFSLRKGIRPFGQPFTVSWGTDIYTP